MAEVRAALAALEGGLAATVAEGLRRGLAEAGGAERAEAAARYEALSKSFQLVQVGGTSLWHYVCRCVVTVSLRHCIITVSLCHCIVTVSSLYRHCTVTVSLCHCIITVSSLYHCITV
eukprot:7647340-Pyramimonas_sp.AAC.1